MIPNDTLYVLSIDSLKITFEPQLVESLDRNSQGDLYLTTFVKHSSEVKNQSAQEQNLLITSRN